jgi:hypothetical protein
LRTASLSEHLSLPRVKVKVDNMQPASSQWPPSFLLYSHISCFQNSSRPEHTPTADHTLWFSTTQDYPSHNSPIHSPYLLFISAGIPLQRGCVYFDDYRTGWKGKTRRHDIKDGTKFYQASVYLFTVKQQDMPRTWREFKLFKRRNTLVSFRLV